MPLKLIRTVATAVALVGLASTANAEIFAKQDAIDYRKASFKVLQGNFQVLGDMAQGNRSFDEVEYLKRTRHVSALAEMPWEAFIEGSYRDSGLDTSALASVASDPEGFAQRVNDFTDAAKALGDDDASNVTQSRRLIGQVANTCRSCHQEYRHRD